LLILQRDFEFLFLLVTNHCYLHFVARTVFCQHFLQIRELVNLLAVQCYDYIIFLQDAGSGTTFNNFGHIDTLFHTKFVGLLLQFFGPAFVHLQVCAQITTLDAKERALHGTKLFQVGYHLCHNAGRDGKTIAGISTRG